MKVNNIKPYKIVKRYTMPATKYGKVKLTNKNIEPHETDTIYCLSRFGFDVETIIPSNIPKSKNPDILMLSTVWEMKGPRTANVETIKTKFRKAVKQAGGKAIFDLRNAGMNKEKIEIIIMNLFDEIREMRRIMIIKDNNTILDIYKKKR